MNTEEKEYFFINSFFQISKETDNGMTVDIMRKACGNYFLNKWDAENLLTQIEIILKFNEKRKAMEKDIEQRIKELSTEDKTRLIQCIFCQRNPLLCGSDEQEEDENGMCRKYVGKVIFEPLKKGDNKN